ncbi:unnamed protein product [Schistocephalus solidus]|uniref:Uncharacterized protein n=1 Tax=Schistocephalus solidus TaxID=70667 RepID=A0A183TDY9_SCHSO|nr:unnamed protein product [Schistocephalus solidus]
MQCNNSPITATSASVNIPSANPDLNPTITTTPTTGDYLAKAPGGPDHRHHPRSSNLASNTATIATGNTFPTPSTDETTSDYPPPLTAMATRF